MQNDTLIATRWRIYLQGFHFRVRLILCKLDKTADYLSRMCEGKQTRPVLNTLYVEDQEVTNEKEMPALQLSISAERSRRSSHAGDVGHGSLLTINSQAIAYIFHSLLSMWHHNRYDPYYRRYRS